MTYYFYKFTQKTKENHIKLLKFSKSSKDDKNSLWCYGPVTSALCRGFSGFHRSPSWVFHTWLGFPIQCAAFLDNWDTPADIGMNRNCFSANSALWNSLCFAVSEPNTCWQQFLPFSTVQSKIVQWICSQTGLVSEQLSSLQIRKLPWALYLPCSAAAVVVFVALYPLADSKCFHNVVNPPLFASYSFKTHTDTEISLNDVLLQHWGLAYTYSCCWMLQGEKNVLLLVLQVVFFGANCRYKVIQIFLRIVQLLLKGMYLKG